MLETDYDCFPKSLHLILITQLQNGIYRSRHSWTINVTGITVSTTIEILLVSVQQILHARAYLHLDALVELEIVGSLEAHVYKTAGGFRTVVADVSSMMLYQHAARIGSRKCQRKCTQRIIAHGKVAIRVRRAEHAFFERHIGVVLTPRTRLFIPGLLYGKSRLQLPYVSPCQLALQRTAIHHCPLFVAAFVDNDTVFVLTNLGQGKYIRNIGIETLCQQIALPVAPAVIHIGRELRLCDFSSFRSLAN